MCGLVDAWHGITSPILDNPIGRTAATVAATYFGGPWGGAAVNAGMGVNDVATGHSEQLGGDLFRGVGSYFAGDLFGGGGGLSDYGGFDTGAVDLGGSSLEGLTSSGGPAQWLSDLGLSGTGSTLASLFGRKGRQGEGASNGGGLLSSLLSMGGGLFGMSKASGMADRARQVTPWDNYRGTYANKLNELMSDPSRITSMPGYTAGLEAVQRSMAAQGYQGSGNMMTALAKYGGDFFGNEVSRLSGLAGTNISPTISLEVENTANQNLMSSLGLLTSGVRRMGY